MSALVTGATGFIGNRLVHRLAAAGETIYALVQPQSDLSTLNGIGVACLVLDGSTEGLIAAFRKAQPEVVFHLGAFFVAEHTSSQVKKLIDSNLLFSTQLAEACAATGVTCLVNVGTAWQHYQDAVYDPVCLYAATKQAVEIIFRFYVETVGLRVVTLKLHDIYGPEDNRPKLVPRLLHITESGETLNMSPGQQQIDLVHVDDVVDALLNARERLRHGNVEGIEDWVIDSGRPISLRALVNMIAVATGVTPTIRWGARPYRQREVMRPWSKGRRLPNWEPKVSLEAGLRSLLHQHRRPDDA